MNISGIQAAQIGLQVSAHNVANASTKGFEPSRVIFQATAGEGVRPHVEHPKSPQGRQEQSHRDQREQKPSGTDLTQEATEQIEMKAMYNANVKSVEVQAEVLGVLVDTKV